jgi:PAS domain-containing protein
MHAMLCVAADGRIVVANAEAERLFGCPRAELVGMPVDDAPSPPAGHVRYHRVPAVETVPVTDIVMPHMLGREIAEKMLQIKPGIAVLYMSGFARTVLTSQGRLEPDMALLEKPFTQADLLAKAGAVLNGHFPGFGNRDTRPA